MKNHLKKNLHLEQGIKNQVTGPVITDFCEFRCDHNKFILFMMNMMQ